MPSLDTLSSEDIDRLIIEQGMSLGTSAFEHLSVDGETAITIREIEQELNQKVAAGDYKGLD